VPVFKLLNRLITSFENKKFNTFRTSDGCGPSKGIDTKTGQQKPS
jgi:hypothetical protein